MGDPRWADLRLTGQGPVRVGDVLDGLLRKRGVGTQILRTGALDVWADAVGGKIASVTRAKTVAASTLFVEVRSSAWLMELNFMKEALLERLNERLGREGAIDKIILTLMEGEG